MQNDDGVTRSASSKRGKVFRDRRRRGEQWARMLLTAAEVDCLADQGCLDGDNTVDEALAIFVRDRMS